MDANTGNQIWKYKTGGEIHRSPVYSEGTIYIGSLDWYVYAIDVVNGNLKSKFPTGNGVWHTVLVVDGSGKAHKGSDSGDEN